MSASQRGLGARRGREPRGCQPRSHTAPEAASQHINASAVVGARGSWGWVGRHRAQTTSPIPQSECFALLALPSTPQLLTAELGVASPQHSTAHCIIPPAAGDGEFQALLDIWFPEKQPLPTAFLVDTSEEALLLPDWLKLRMIRSEVPRLVDAGTGRARPARGLFCSPCCAGDSDAVASESPRCSLLGRCSPAPGVPDAMPGSGASTMLPLPLPASPSPSGGEAEVPSGSTRHQRTEIKWSGSLEGSLP